ncbi:MAG: Tryptophan synthase alpha chain [Myxococcaceae bacterium]|jgi:hypothetical protein|nr:Tryptophan synthase alpha chain [Myxococcaceae bacterium]MEA2749677.1 hypothetical protein [Myxococcales bacterium]
MDETRSKRKKTKPKRALARSFVVTVAVGIPGGLLAATGCSSAVPPESTAQPGSASQGPGVQTGKCVDEGQQQPCHFSLGRAGDGKVLSCFQGTQTCTGGTWSACGGEGTVTNSVVDLDLVPAATSGIHTLGLGGCGDGICSGPLCKGGALDGQLCSVAGCGAGICVTATCDKGTNKGLPCTVAANCPGGNCVPKGETCANCAADCGICTPGSSSTGLPICTSDPCNPDCKAWNNAQTPGISSGGGLGVTVIGVSGFGQIPNGQISKLLLDSCNTGTRCDSFASFGIPSSHYNCQMDTQCSLVSLGGDGCCHQFDAAEVLGTDLSSFAANAGVDLTIGPGCSDIEKDKYRYFPICNRGATPVPVGQSIKVKYFSPIQPLSPCAGSPGKGNQSCTSTAGYDCSLVVGDATGSSPGLPLAPGTCQLLDTQKAGRAPGGAACTQPSGERWIFVNCDGGSTGVVEGDLTVKPTATVVPPGEPTTAPGILGCANNWTDHSPNNNPPACSVAGPSVISFTADYHATCPSGTAPLWNKLIYDASTPTNASGTSEVFFEAATAPDMAGKPGGFSQFYEIAEAQHNNAGNPYVIGGATLGSDPEKCSFTLPVLPPYVWKTCTNVGIGPAPPCCPKDFEDQFTRSITQTPFEGAGVVLGKQIARQEWLRMKITIKATPDSKTDATLNSWSVSYQCIARE